MVERVTGAAAAVIEGALQHVSPSQIKTYRACPRKWYLEKVQRLAAAASRWANAGTGLHKEVERFYLDGTPPPSQVCKNALEQALPARGAGFEPEVELAEPALFIDGVRVKGRIDLVGTVENVSGARFVEIYDLKTVSSWRYCKTEAELREDVQQGIYAKWAQLRFPDAVAVRVALVYMHRGNAKVRVVTADLTRENITSTWNGCVETVSLMKVTAAETEESLVPRCEGESECGAYGGCPFWARCWSLSERFDKTPEGLPFVSDI